MNNIFGNVVGVSFVPQSDFNQKDSTKADYIKNKPEITEEVTEDSNCLITSGGVYNALKNISVGEDVGSSVQSDWTQADSSKPDYIKNKPGETITIATEVNNSYMATLGEPNATSPFVIWKAVSTSPAEIYDDIQDGTSITVSYMVDGDTVEIEGSTLFTNATLDAQFGVGTGNTGYWGLVNASQTIEEILTQGVWTRADSGKPTVVICLDKNNTSGKSFFTIAAPELLTGETFILTIHTTGTESTTIKLSNEALNLDSVPTENSTNPITSGGIYNILQNIDIGGSVGDISWEDIRDKPFEETRILLEVPTDGNSATMTSQPISAIGGIQFVFTKASDTYFIQPEDMIGATVHVDFQMQGTKFSVTIAEGDIVSLGNGLGFLSFNDAGIFPLCISVNSIGTVTFPMADYYGEDLVFNATETGFYLLNVAGMCVATSYEDGYIKQIDPKFIPANLDFDLSDYYTKIEINNLLGDVDVVLNEIGALIGEE